MDSHDVNFPESLCKEVMNSEHNLYKTYPCIYKPEMLVFIDETGSNSRDARRKFGYSLRGKPVKAVGLYGRGKHLSAISAISGQCIFPPTKMQNNSYLR